MNLQENYKRLFGKDLKENLNEISPFGDQPNYEVNWTNISDPSDL